MTNLRSQILNADDIKEEIVEVEEWGCKILVKGLTGKARSEILNEAISQDGSFDFTKVYPDLVIGTSYDPETEERIFQKEDRDMLNEKSGAALEKIAEIAVKLSGLKEAAQEKAVKN